jgi:hypothetical protein
MMRGASILVAQIAGQNLVAAICIGLDRALEGGKVVAWPFALAVGTVAVPLSGTLIDDDKSRCARFWSYRYPVPAP